MGFPSCLIFVLFEEEKENEYVLIVPAKNHLKPLLVSIAHYIL